MISLLQKNHISETGILPALISDYLLGKDSLKNLFTYKPEITAFENAIADKSKDETDRKLLTEVLQSQYADVKTSAAVSENISALASENTFTVCTAHQPNLFLGPLYTIYKIASVINLAMQLKNEYEAYSFVPVFWMGSEDHDAEELNHFFIDGRKFQWRENVTGAVGRAKSEILKEVTAQLKSAIGENDLTKSIDEGISKYKTLGKFTQHLLNEIFKEQGLVVIDGDDMRLKKRFNCVIEDEILNGRAANILTEHLQFLEANYEVQAKPREINFFYLSDNFRERILFDKNTNRFTVNNQSLSFSKEELLAEIKIHPERFSPNVILRPIYQEVILPNLAFIGGGGELSYWLELKPLFDYYKLNFPVLLLRNSAAIISKQAQSKMEKLNLKATDFFGSVEALIKTYVKTESRVSLQAEKEEADKIFDKIIARAESADVTLKQSAMGEKQKLANSLDALEAKMLKAEKRKQETAVNQIRAIHAVLFPQNNLQERVENFIPFYDSAFIAKVVEQMNPLENSFLTFVNE